MISLQGVSKRFDRVDALAGIDWEIQGGEWWGIIGPNGSGKSTLLQMLSGVEAPTAGKVTIHGRDVRDYGRKELARTLAVLQQEGLGPTDFTVREVLEMGRYPFQNWFGREPSDAGPLLDSIMERLELKSLEYRRLDQLSGGQRQRAALGKVMAQEPSILLLDEPTTYLDIRYQLQFMDMVADWRRDTGITVISVLHDLNLAAQFCDRLLVLHEGRMAGKGSPEDMLTENNIRRIFRVDTSVVAHPANGSPQVLLTAGAGKSEEGREEAYAGAEQ
ncbi:ABC transporter ATP-binding protein [Paenibacillus sp. DMB20]|uniref:ABC transporter ATP-binding protein n=1 Tax=Paenibacillus sp. DMB20 TaxID=1642570 RepID=UPI000627A50C|nr:ABC transporter ATP-binding protein [Paenibacillus sp. DMB20]KKO52983.1 ABC transporter ATP-binding protein [Paenibacillus sp. DMB20]KKO53530.1 ABC transporter ATP-binding protein [Paenibacillus sp. DMB20]